jgi:hypothetical protein
VAAARQNPDGSVLQTIHVAWRVRRAPRVWSGGYKLAARLAAAWLRPLVMVHRVLVLGHLPHRRRIPWERPPGQWAAARHGQRWLVPAGTGLQLPDCAQAAHTAELQGPARRGLRRPSIAGTDPAGNPPRTVVTTHSQIRSNGRTVQNHPVPVTRWAAAPGSSSSVDSWLQPWQQCGQQSKRPRRPSRPGLTAQLG